MGNNPYSKDENVCSIATINNETTGLPTRQSDIKWQWVFNLIDIYNLKSKRYPLALL